MSHFVYHTLMLLEDSGMKIESPRRRHSILNGHERVIRLETASFVDGRRVSLEQNQEVKFLNLFSLLDFYVDSNHQEMEGLDYTKKYKNLPKGGDFNLILSQIYRLGRLFRNAYVHNRKQVTLDKDFITIDYNRAKHKNFIKISHSAWSKLLTLIVMYLKQDLGSGEYFLGRVRSYYSLMIQGIESYSDDFGTNLEPASAGVKCSIAARCIHYTSTTIVDRELIRIGDQLPEVIDGEGIDFYFTLGDNEFLVPLEALNDDLSISIADLHAKWKKPAHFPIMKTQ